MSKVQPCLTNVHFAQYYLTDFIFFISMILFSLVLMYKHTINFVNIAQRCSYHDDPMSMHAVSQPLLNGHTLTVC